MRALPTLVAVGFLAALSGCTTMNELSRTAGAVATGAQSVGIAPVNASWESNASPFENRVGATITYNCPPNGEAHSVWGTDTYTSDSSVCSAAVHMGLLSMSRGGTVTIQMRPGMDNYVGSTRNGVRTSNYGRWGGSFVFVR